MSMDETYERIKSIKKMELSPKIEARPITMQQPPSEVIGFMKSLREGDHIVLLQEDSEYARRMEFQFLLDGLKKGESCTYVSIFDEPEEIERMMKSFGIDVEHYKEGNHLRVQKLPVSPASNDAGSHKDLEDFNSQINASEESVPFRVVGRLYSPTIMSKKELARNLLIENHSQESGRKNGITICSYSTEDMKPEINSDWFTALIRSHDGVVFAPSPGNGVAFYLGRSATTMT